jgi:glutamate N-acetyltransferase/amino-acid N-acetyltransferase
MATKQLTFELDSDARITKRLLLQPTTIHSLLPAAITVTALGVDQGHHHKQYIWTGHRLQAMDSQDIQELSLLEQQQQQQQQQQKQQKQQEVSKNTISTPFHEGGGAKTTQALRSLRSNASSAFRDLRAAFLPNPKEVTSDYWENACWRACHRLFSSMASIFATQSLLQAVGVGAKRSLPAAATINWVLKDGLGRLGRLTVATRFGESFDADLKRFRYTTSILYAVAISLEYLTPIFPQHFLAMASLANVGKSIGLATFIATQPAFHRSFARSENLADISAKAQAQQMVMDNIGLALSIAATHAVCNNEAARRALPLLSLPILGLGDLFCIYKELRSVHLRTLNRERTELIIDTWMKTRCVPGPKKVSREESFVLPEVLTAGPMPMVICSLDKLITNEAEFDTLLGTTTEGRKGGKHGTLAGSDLASSSSSSSKYVMTYTAPNNNMNNKTNSSNMNSMPVSRGKVWWGGLLPGSNRPTTIGQIRVSLRSDVSSEDIILAVLHAAYLRDSILSFSNNNSVVDDKVVMVRDSGKKAKRHVGGLLKEMRGSGWQLSPFTLSSTEKRMYFAC